MDKVYIITKGDVLEGGSSIYKDCCYSLKDAARNDALALFEIEKENFSKRLSKLKEKYRIPAIYLNKDGSEKEWKEEHENYFTNGFDFIEIIELEVKS